ncbi:MAG: SpoIVB peptidase [Clostridia bacterium]|nr:SpoIVB peptidase [Clostridia bacterium]
MEKTIRILCILITVCALIALGGIVYLIIQLPDVFQVEEGKTLSVGKTVYPIQTVDPDQTVISTSDSQAGSDYTVTLGWLGVFPIKDVTVSVVKEGDVVLGGFPFGIKLYADGVMVVSLSDVDTRSGGTYPAKNAGIRVGDIILSINGKTVYTNEEVSQAVKLSNGKPMEFRVRRDNVDFSATVTPAKSVKENCYKIGIWVRDSSAGIGTVTFYDPKSNVLAGLGHAVCDVDTGNVIPISSGEIVPARIYGVTKSEAGTPGELRGGFDFGTFGALLKNCDRGVYGTVDAGTVLGQYIPIMLKQDITTGDAQIYTTVSGNKPQWYDIKISQIRYRDTTGTRSMVVEITDKTLLEKTGGIVQGMSGSPIVQNGKLVGAVTHVFVNDPTKGYAIFAENMLETAQNVALQEQKEAS